MMKKDVAYTAALIGLGRIGFTLGFDKKREQPASHTHALMKNRRIRLVAGADTDRQKRVDWHSWVPGSQVFESSAELYKSFSPDIIVIAVNEDSHKAEALCAIEKKPRLVILEKPVALNSQEASEIQESAQRNGVPVLINHERRFAYDYQTARNYLPQIGELQSIHAALYSGLCVF